MVLVTKYKTNNLTHLLVKLIDRSSKGAGLNCVLWEPNKTTPELKITLLWCRLFLTLEAKKKLYLISHSNVLLAYLQANDKLNCLFLPTNE